MMVLQVPFYQSLDFVRLEATIHLAYERINVLIVIFLAVAPYVDSFSS